MNNILYFGDSKSSSTSRHRADALVRIGLNVTLYDPFAGLAKYFGTTWKSRFHYHTGYRFLQGAVCAWLEEHLKQRSKFDLIWIDGGELFGQEAIGLMKADGIPVVLFNHDDPTGPRDRRRFSSLLRALPFYDLVTAVRAESEAEIKSLCAGKILRIWRTYDEVKHSPANVDSTGYKSDVCFIGTWIRGENRDEFILELIARGVNVSIWGDRWNRSPSWQRIAPHWRGAGLSGADYVAAIKGAKVCLGLLSKGNRDLHTTRTMEIPYAGGVLCAERTSEHLALYEEDKEAVFWSDSAECAEKCLELLRDDKKREHIRLAGSLRVRENRVGNEYICRQILEAIDT